MLEGIFNFFQWIADLIGTVFDFIVNFFESLINFLMIIPTLVSFATSAIGYLPSSVMIFATVAITAAVVLLILGRGNN